ncbi:predicted protein [Sclerotinia sclerotiorum 1980 UF-70]|nr:predicted protein [Sclerotinia sclerotiorum 1980 UF-70]EDN91764.1 predicted protein [Sclerotinia sclerotiorum 1980 UF-70]
MDHISTGPTDLFKTNQLRSVQAGQASTTVPEEGSEYVLSSIESDTDMSDSYHPQGFITGGSAAGAKMAVEVKSTTSRVLSQQASVEEAKAGRPRAIKKKKIAEKDSAFRPTPESESDSDHDIIPLKKVRSSRTRKLINEKSPYTGPSTPEKRVVSDNARNPTARHPAPGHETERPRSILVKLRIPKDAPPAKTDGDFLSYTKPRESLSQQSQYNADDREPISANDFYGAPPVPRIPQHVRLPSGEMLHTRNSRPQRTQTTKEPGDWPEDLEIF